MLATIRASRITESTHTKAIFRSLLIQQQLQIIRSLWSSRHIATYPLPCVRAPSPHGVTSGSHEAAPVSPAVWEQTVGELVTNGHVTGPLAEELDKDPGIQLMRKLIWKFRAGAIVKNLGTLTRLIMIHASDTYLETLLYGYFRQSKPQPFASEECKGFLCYLQKTASAVPYLQDIIRFEEATMQALATQTNQYVRFGYNPCVLLEAILGGGIPAQLETGSYELEIPPAAMPEIAAYQV